MMDKQQLWTDLHIDELAAVSRRRTARRRASSVACMVACAGLATFLAVRNPPTHQDVVADAPAPATAVKTPTPVQATSVADNPKEFEFTILRNDDELLAALAELGPAIIDRPDGSRYLVLTASR